MNTNKRLFLLENPYKFEMGEIVTYKSRTGHEINSIVIERICKGIFKYKKWYKVFVDRDLAYYFEENELSWSGIGYINHILDGCIKYNEAWSKLEKHLRSQFSPVGFMTYKYEGINNLVEKLENGEMKIIKTEKPTNEKESTNN